MWHLALCMRLLLPQDKLYFLFVVWDVLYVFECIGRTFSGNHANHAWLLFYLLNVLACSSQGVQEKTKWRCSQDTGSCENEGRRIIDTINQAGPSKFMLIHDVKLMT
mmetsp:Transcript_13114/g.15754  ORF Transcript_13114/g.15754 Transcript_13114/m.15754 type:complete len:107 (-) Transcript_13114:86-406(-)